jgi:hypothetical protein
MSEKYKVIDSTLLTLYVNSSYRNYEEDKNVFCNVNIEPLW